MPHPIIRRTLAKPAGVNPNYPLTLTSLAGWFKADSLSLADGTAVGNGSTTDWLDQSGNGHTMTQATAGSRPTYNTNKFGSKPGIRFSGGTGGNNLVTASAFTLGDYTMFFVWKFAVATDGLLMGNSALNRQVRVNRSGLQQSSTYNGAVEIISNTMTGVGTGTTSPKCVVFRRTGSTGDFFYNNTKFASSAGSSSANLVLDCFAIASTSGVSTMDGWMAEVLIYSAFKTDAQVNSVYSSYLQPRWGLA